MLTSRFRLCKAKGKPRCQMPTIAQIELRLSQISLCKQTSRWLCSLISTQ